MAVFSSRAVTCYDPCRSHRCPEFALTVVGTSVDGATFILDHFGFLFRFNAFFSDPGNFGAPPP